jgi:hypothetical protein
MYVLKSKAIIDEFFPKGRKDSKVEPEKELNPSYCKGFCQISYSFHIFV